MQNNRHKYFRWTARTGWLTFAYVVAFPAFIGYLGTVTDVSGFFILEESRIYERRKGTQWRLDETANASCWLRILGAEDAIYDVEADFDIAGQMGNAREEERRHDFRVLKSPGNGHGVGISIARDYLEDILLHT